MEKKVDIFLIFVLNATLQVQKVISYQSLGKMCGRGKGEKLDKVIRLIQIHVLAILAGNMRLKEPLVSEIDDLLMELRTIRAKSDGLGH